MSASDAPWEPNLADLNQAVLLLQALRDPTRPDHSSALHSLEANATVPAFILHIMHAFAYGMNYSISVDLRQLSGLIIKNYVFPHLHQLDPTVQQIIKKELLQVLSDSMSDLRKTAAILIGRIAETFTIDTWVHMLMYIIQLLDVQLLQSNPNLFDGAMYAIKRICEDSSVKMSAEETVRPLETLVPKLIYLLNVPHPAVRLHALECYNCLLYLLEGPHSINLNGLRSRNSSFDSSSANHNASSDKPSTATSATHPLIIHMHAFISSIASLGHDRQADLRKQICISITAIACLHVALLEPYMSNILEYMLTMLLDVDEAVAMEACEFFMALTTDASTRSLLLPHAGKLIANIISRLYLTPEQMEAERIEEEEESTGAKQVNIQPIHYRGSGGEGLDGNTSHGGGMGDGDGGGGGGTGSTGDEYAEQSELSSKWTLRKQSALLLDNLAMSLDNSLVLSIALPIIQANFQHENVLIREAGMLALGALCNGCLDAMVVYIPQLFPFLLQNLLDPLPEMRSITCWVLSRYSRLYGLGVEGGEVGLSPASTGGKGGVVGGAGPGRIGFSVQQGCVFYIQSLYAILNTMYDPTPKVQVAACSALCILIEHSFPLPPTQGMAAAPSSLGDSTIAGGGGYSSNSSGGSIIAGAGGGGALSASSATSSPTSSSASSPDSPEENLLFPHLPVILVYLRVAFSLYGHKARLILIDTIGTLADTLQASFQTVHAHMNTLPFLESLLTHYAVHVHPWVAQALHLLYTSSPSTPQEVSATQTLPTGQTIAWRHPLASRTGYVDLYFPCIFHEFVCLEDHDPRLFPVLECYTSVLAIVAQDTRVYLPYILARCVRLLMRALCPRDVVAHIVHEWEAQVTAHGLPSPHHAFPSFPLLPTPSPDPPAGSSLASFALRVLASPPPLPHGSEDVLHTDYAICVLDVLSALSDCLQEGVMAYLLPFRAVLVHLVCVACKEGLPECRQSAFSLLGELVKHALPWFVTARTQIDLSPPALAWPGGLSPGHQGVSGVAREGGALREGGSNNLALLREVMGLCLANVDVAYPLVCNNASWTIGELVMALQAYLHPAEARAACPRGGLMGGHDAGSVSAAAAGGEGGGSPLVADFLRPYISKTVHALVTALQSVELADNLKVNIAVTMGRCAIICPMEVAELADDFFADWCSVLSYPCPALEHYHAFSGLLAVVHQHPALLASKTHLYSLLVACLSYSSLPPDHAAAYHHVLRYCQQQHPGLWEKVVRTFSQTYSVQALCAMYALT